MKKASILLLIISGVFTVKSQNRLSYFHKAILEFTQKYADSLAPIMRFHNWDEQFLVGNKTYLEGFPTYFHEQIHLFNDSLNYNSNYGTCRFYFFNNQIFKIPKFAVLNSSVIDALVPIKLQKDITRYNLYIHGVTKDNVALSPDTKANGIYGLLEEFIAYYYSNLSFDKMYYYLKDHYSFQQPIWFDYWGERSNFVNTYYEFRLFIGYYFLYCKNNNALLYTSLVNNVDLMRLIKNVDNAFKVIVANYWRVRKQSFVKSRNIIFAGNGYLISKASNDRYILPELQMKELEEAYTEEVKFSVKIL